MTTNTDKPASMTGQMQPIVCLEPITVNMFDSVDKQIIAVLNGMLKQQERYTNNAVRECMRLRAIIAKCDRCRRGQMSTSKATRDLREGSRVTVNADVETSESTKGY